MTKSQSEEKKDYLVRCCCLNCGYGNEGYEIIEYKIPCGLLVGNYLIDKKCPYCKCLSLVRKSNEK